MNKKEFLLVLVAIFVVAIVILVFLPWLRSGDNPETHPPTVYR